MGGEFELESQREEFEGAVFDVVSERWRAPDGRILDRQTVIHPGGAGVLAVDGGSVILVRQYRQSVRDYVLEVPAGSIDPPDTAMECARRELKEETGYAASSWEFLGSVYATPGYCAEEVSLFLATGLEPGMAEPEEGEYIEVVRVPIGELREAMADGRIRDSKTMVAIYRFLDRG